MFKQAICSISLILILCLTANTSAELIAQWKFDEGSGTTATDSIGGYDGTLTGDTAWTTGKLRGALEFDGDGDYVDCWNDPVFNPSGSFGVTLWAYIRDWSVPWAEAIIGKGGDNDRGGWAIRRGGGETVAFTCANNVIAWDLDGNEAPPQNEWVHIACVYDQDNSIAYIYFNGIEDASLEASGGTIAANDAHLYLGTRGNQAGTGPDDWGASFFDGILDDVRYYNHALTQAEVAQSMTGTAIGAGVASRPFPESGVDNVPRDTILSWKPGEYPCTHNVYFGTDFNDVNDGTALIIESQDANIYDPGSLELGQTYYWRVDEVNDSADATVYRGSVWSFTTEAYSLKIPSSNITASASSQASDIQVPENTINESGLDPNNTDLHTKITDDMWATDPAAFGEPAWIQYDFDKVYKLHQMLVWNYNGEVILSGFGVKDVNIEYSEDGQTWNQLADANQFVKAPGTTGYEYNTTVDFNGLAAKSVRINILSNWGGGLYNQYGLSEVRFMYIPVRAREPYPADMNDVPTDVTLSWRAGREAQQHIVSLSTDQQAVSDGNAVITTIGEASYGPLSLDLGSTYYWRIDEVNDTATPTTWIGDVWNFNTQEYIVVEDFERYTDDDPNRIWDVWSDGWDDNNNGSTMGYPNPDFIAGEHYVETDIVHGGEQSAPIFYDNSSATYSEVSVNTSNFAIGSDWAPGSPETLLLWFYGDPNNTVADMYIKINGEKISYDGDAMNLILPLWTQWTIDLSAINTELTNINTLSIGMDGGADGMILLDDIRLYADAPVAPIQIWMEAESGTVVSPMAIFTDNPDASGGSYVTVEAGNSSASNPPESGGTVTYTFEAEAGTYTIDCLHIAPDGSSDSIWVNIDGSTVSATLHASGWIRSSLSTSTSWAWSTINSMDGGGEVEFSLPTSGTYTLEIAYREEGALLDAFMIKAVE